MGQDSPVPGRPNSPGIELARARLGERTVWGGIRLDHAGRVGLGVVLPPEGTRVRAKVISYPWYRPIEPDTARTTVMACGRKFR